MSQRLKNLFNVSLILKLLIAAIAPVSLDEYYYNLWGQFPSLSYFDHPPMVGWIMSLSRDFLWVSEGTMRWPFVIMSHLTVFFWYLIVKEDLRPKILYWFILTALLNPLWGMGGIIATPDIPLLFFWSLSLLATKNIITSARWRDYILFGASLGLGFLAKYQIVLFLPALFILLFQRGRFDLFFSKKTLVTVVVGLTASSPVLFWNYYNDWASFAFQWEHGMSSSSWSWTFPLDYAGAQVGLLFPPFLLFWFRRNGWRNHWLTPFALFPLAFFLYSSFKGRVEANWPIMAYPAIYALAFTYSTKSSLAWMKRTNVLWGTLLTVLCLLLPFRDHLPLKNIKLFEASRYDVVLESLQTDTQYLGYNYQLSALLSFKLGRLVCKFPKYGRVDHFNYLEPCHELPDDFVYLSENGFLIELEKDFPEFEILETKPIGENFISIHMVRK